MKPALLYYNLMRNQFSHGINGRSPENFFAMLPKILNNTHIYIWMIHSIDVMKNIMPKTSLRQGMTGFVYASCSYILNILNSSLKASYLALNYVNAFPTFLFPLNFQKNPAYLFLPFFSSKSFSYWPSFIKFAIAVCIFYRVFFISPVFLALGLCLNQLIISIGKAKSPTPPNITTKIHPKNDIIAMIQTAKDTQVVIDVQVTVGTGVEAVPDLEQSKAIQSQGISTYLKNAHEINKIKTDMTTAPKRKANALSKREHMGSSSSVSYKNMAQGMRTVMKNKTIIYKKNQNARISIALLTMADLLATSRGTMRA